MITIPEEIKTLLKADGTRKNFRVHFPNGERDDITNDNLVAESLSFTESICSQNTLVFGLCESSVIEFETIDVENIKGDTIECYIEVYCSSTVSNAEYKEDLSAYVYPICYGTFIVNSCKKQADMTHRDVVAYNALSVPSFNNIPIVTDVLNHFYFGSNNLKLSVKTLVDLLTVSESDMESVPGDSNSGTITFTDYTLSYIYDSWSPYEYGKTGNAFALFPSVSTDFLNKVKEIETYVSVHFSGSLIRGAKYITDGYTYLNTSGSTNVYYYENGKTEKTIGGYNSVNVFPAYRVIDSDTGCYNQCAGESIYIYKQFILKDKSGNVIIDTGSDGVDLKYKRFDALLTSEDELYLAPKTTKKTLTLYKDGSTSTTVSKSVYLYDFSEIFSLNLQDVIQAYCELSGKFGRMNRDGKFELVSIKDNFTNQNAGTLSMSDCSSVWYEDEDSKPIGRIECYYNVSKSETAYAYKDIVDDYLPGQYKVYSISDNYFIKNNIYTEDEIQAIFDDMTDNISDITYMPMDITCIGRPDVEAGDVFKVELNDGTSFNGFVEQRTLSGIQGLSDSITSKDDTESSSGSSTSSSSSTYLSNDFIIKDSYTKSVTVASGSASTISYTTVNRTDDGYIPIGCWAHTGTQYLEVSAISGWNTGTTTRVRVNNFSTSSRTANVAVFKVWAKTDYVTENITTL